MHMEKSESEGAEMEFSLFCRDSVMYQVQASFHDLNAWSWNYKTWQKHAFE